MHKLTQSFAIAAILAIATLATGIPAQPLHAQAQQGQLTVTGVVTDAEGVPLPGATIRIENTTTGTITDAQGRYPLKVRKGQALEALYMGYETRTMKIIGNQTKIDFALSEDENVLEDVVVIGYGSVKKEDLTGSVVNVKMNDLQSGSVLSIDNALQDDHPYPRLPFHHGLQRAAVCGGRHHRRHP